MDQQFTDHIWHNHTVDERNPAPPNMYETLETIGYLPYQLMQDFFHQQYYIVNNSVYLYIFVVVKSGLI